jgi:hypothetical protein
MKICNSQGFLCAAIQTCMMVGRLICNLRRYRFSVFHMTEKTIQSVPVMPFAMMLACIGAVIGAILGVFYALFFGALFSLIPSTTQTGIDLNFLRIVFVVGALIVMPIVGFVGGLIQGLLYAVVYNFFAPRIGGIKLRFKED